MPPILRLTRHTGYIGTNRMQSFPPIGAPKMRESQQLFFGLRLVSRMFEEYQQPAIQTSTVARKVQVTAWIQYSAI